MMATRATDVKSSSLFCLFFFWHVEPEHPFFVPNPFL